MTWKTKSSKILSITTIVLIIVNILLAIILPFFVISNKELVTNILWFQYNILIPVTSLLALISFIKILMDNKKK